MSIEALRAIDVRKTYQRFPVCYRNLERAADLLLDGVGSPLDQNATAVDEEAG